MMARLTARRATIVAGVVALGCVALVRASGDSAPATSEPVDLSAIGELSTDAQIAVDERGTTIAVWDNGAIKTATGRISGRATVKGAVRPAGGGWRAVTSLSSPAAGQHAYRPQLAVNARGTAVAVWDLQKDGNHVVQAAVRPAGGSWGAAVSLSRPGRACGPRIGVACRSSVAQRVARELAPRVVIDRRGNIAAIWERFAGRSSSVQVAVRAAGGRWRAAVDVVRFPGARSQDFAEPQIALDPTGEAIAVWTRARPSARTRANGSVRGPRERVVQAAVRRPDGRWRAPTDLSAVARNGGHPQVALDARGNALAVWSRDGTMQGATRAPNGDWTTPVDISAGGVHAYGPALAVDRRGGAIVLWTAAGPPRLQHRAGRRPRLRRTLAGTRRHLSRCARHVRGRTTRRRGQRARRRRRRMDAAATQSGRRDAIPGHRAGRGASGRRGMAAPLVARSRQGRDPGAGRRRPARQPRRDLRPLRSSPGRLHRGTRRDGALTPRPSATPSEGYAGAARAYSGVPTTSLREATLSVSRRRCRGSMGPRHVAVTARDDSRARPVHRAHVDRRRRPFGCRPAIGHEHRARVRPPIRRGKSRAEPV